MSFSLDTSNTKYLPNYAAAVAHHDSIKPIRGSNCRPLAERTKKHLNIRKEKLGPYDAIVVRLHSTDLITYTPDNRVTLNMGGYNTTSTRGVIYAVTGVWTHGGSPIWIQRGSTHYVFKNGCQVDMSEHRSPKIIDPIYPVIHTLKRKAMNSIRKDYAPFITHLSGFIKLVGEDGFTEEMVNDEPWKLFCAPHELLERARGTHVQMHEAARFIIKKTRSGNKLVKLKLALDFFNTRLIEAHADEVLTRSTITDGRKVKDRYAWAVNRGS